MTLMQNLEWSEEGAGMDMGLCASAGRPISEVPTATRQYYDTACEDEMTMQYNISSLDLRFNHTTRRGQMISVLCMRPPRVRLGPSKTYQGTGYIKGSAREGQRGGEAPTIYCAYGSSQHKWIRGCCCPFEHGV